MVIEGNKFVVTGGAGLIGSHVVEQLLAAGAGEIIILDTMVRGCRENIAAPLKDDRVRLHEADIRDPDEIARFFAGAQGCFHLAALRITQCASEPRNALEVMVDGTYNVLDACVKNKIDKVIFSSSASIYGMADEFPTTETHHPWHNDTWYGAIKTCGEGMLRSFKAMFDLDYVALRYFNVYGPRMDVHGKYTEVLIRWLECFDRGEQPKVFGDGSQTMDFIYVEDIARANIAAMRSAVTDEVFNIASGTETSLLDLLHALAEACGTTDATPEFLPPRSVNAVPRRLADTTAARERLEFEATTDLTSGLRELVEWRRQTFDK